MRGKGGGARIGNWRSECTTCNNFNQTIRYRATRALRELHAEDYARLRREAEVDMYPQVIEDFTAMYPESRDDVSRETSETER